MIPVVYTCGKCRVHDATVQVEERKEGQDVVEWMEQVCIRALMRHHAQRSPYCNADKFQTIKIPTQNRKVVGGPVQH